VCGARQYINGKAKAPRIVIDGRGVVRRWCAGGAQVVRG
jgi:hypothetical protein